MIGLYKYIESPFGEKTYFAGANSGVGFVNLFGDFYEESSLDRLYIIKGGPGTGKSTFMRILAERAADAGAGAEYFLCGSDPSSLDAVVLSGGGKRIAVIDGTSPHAYDAKYPGAVSAVLDFGSFWDKGILESERGRIISLAKSDRPKKACRIRAKVRRRSSGKCGLPQKIQNTRGFHNEGCGVSRISGKPYLMERKRS